MYYSKLNIEKTMNNSKKVLQILLILFGMIIFYTQDNFAQIGSPKHLTGTIYGIVDHDTQPDTLSLVAANVYWMNSDKGTVTDDEGRFSLQRLKNGENMLVVSYVAFECDTIGIGDTLKTVEVYLNKLRIMEEITITADLPSVIRKTDAPINSETITRAGLEKLACCNLAESFENTAAVDVDRTDAVSGAKRIKMLGLAGFYTQILIEKKPVMRGLISPFALEYIPGYWIESINISKGTSSVVTGYESITGQINVELKKPENSGPYSLNAYQNTMGRSEMVLTLAKQVNPFLSTMLLSYGTFNRKKWDKNADSFIDMPLVYNFNIMNRWKYRSGKKAAQIGFKVIHDERDGGQTNFDFDDPKISSSIYGSHNRIKRYEFYTKTGMTLNKRGSNIGLIISGFMHKQNSFRGAKTYSGDESSLYSNLMYHLPIENHNLAAGISYLYDRRDEKYLGDPFISTEKVPGVFTEYTYQIKDRFTILAGFRYDHHNLFGSLYTPRFHARYNYDRNMAFRFSLGKGYRNPQIFMDNPAILASSRDLKISEDLKVEEAWNAGIQLIRHFSMGEGRPATFIFDYYRTDFQNQVIVDLDRDPRKVHLHNLSGKSYSNSAQFELNSSPVRGFDITAAYRINDVKTTYNDELSEVPLNSKHKGLLVFSYTLPDKKWQFDITSQLNGKSRLPNTSGNPAEYRASDFSPDYVLLFAQVRRKFSRWEIYSGIENITNYRQKNPILAWNEPFSRYFDSSLIWGPVVGRRIYMGIRMSRQ